MFQRAAKTLFCFVSGSLSHRLQLSDAPGFDEDPLRDLLLHRHPGRRIAGHLLIPQDPLGRRGIPGRPRLAAAVLRDLHRQRTLDRGLPRHPAADGGTLPERHPVTRDRAHPLRGPVHGNYEHPDLPIFDRRTSVFRNFLLLRRNFFSGTSLGSFQHSGQSRTQLGQGGGEVVGVVRPEEEARRSRMKLKNELRNNLFLFFVPYFIVLF